MKQSKLWALPYNQRLPEIALPLCNQPLCALRRIRLPHFAQARIKRDARGANAGRNEAAIRGAQRREARSRYFVIIGRGEAAVGAAGEIEKVSHTFQPSGRLAASNSLYPLRFRYPCLSPSGNRYPICGPTPTTRDSNEPTRSPDPLSPVTWLYKY